MHGRKRKKKRGGDAVELNLAAMLDMAFQLLAFFILTFKPAPTEGQVELRMPPPQPATGAKGGAAVGSKDNNKPIEPLSTLVITVLGRPNGELGEMAIGEVQALNVNILEARVHKLLGDPGTPFEQVIIQVGPTLHYEQLMKIVDICTRAKTPDGKLLSKLSFVELPTQ